MSSINLAQALDLSSMAPRVQKEAGTASQTIRLQSPMCST